jgi:membrane-bound lytic murein transglycosylase D
MTYYCEHNICPASAQLPAATDTVMVDRNLHADQIVALCNISAEALKALNPQYRTGLIPGFSHPCTLRLPNASMMAFIEAGDSIYAYRATELLATRAEIEVAQAQLTPQNTKITSRRGRGRGRSAGRGSRSATVRRGDTLSAIAKRNGTTVSKLRRLNGIRGNNIKAGQKIRVK